MGEQGKMRLWFSRHTCPDFKKSVFKRVGKIGFMQISLELHQPNMHVGYRVIPLSVHHSVTCQTPFLMESDPLCCKILFVTGYLDDE